MNKHDFASYTFLDTSYLTDQENNHYIYSSNNKLNVALFGQQKFRVANDTPIFKTPENILKNSVIFDIETLGIQTESVHEMATFDIANKKLNIYLPEINLLRNVDDTLETANMVSKASASKVDVLKGVDKKITSQMTFKDVAFVDYLLNKKDYIKVQKQIQDLKRNSVDFANLDATLQQRINLLETKLNSIERIDNDSTLTSVGKEKRKAQELITTDVLEALNDTEVRKQSGLSFNFEKDNFYLSRYILPESKAYQDFAKEDPNLSKYYKYLSDRTANYDPQEVIQNYIKKFKHSSGYIEELTKGLNINVKTGNMTDLLQEMASDIQGKSIWIANAMFESKKIGAQIMAASESELISQEFDLRMALGIPAGKELTKNQQALVRARAFQKTNPFLRLGRPASASTGEPFYSTGPEYNRILTEARQSSDFTNVYKSVLETTSGEDTRDIQDVFRSQQSMLQKAGVLDAKRPMGLSVEAQARLYMFSDMLMKGASEDQLKEVLSQFKETHIAPGDVLIHENIAFTRSMYQSFALQEYLDQTDIGKALFEEAKTKNSGLLYEAVAQGKIFSEMTPAIEEIAMQQRIVSNLKNFSEYGRTTEAMVTGSSYRVQQRLADSEKVLEETYIETPRYKRDTLFTYDEFRTSILDNKMYDFPKKQDVFGKIEQELIDQGIARRVSKDLVVFHDAITDASKVAPEDEQVREKLRGFLSSKEKHVGQLISRFEETAKDFSSSRFKISLNNFFTTKQFLNKSKLTITPGKTSQEKVINKEIQKKMDLANLHKQTAVLFNEYLEPRINKNVVDDITNHINKTGYGLTATGYSESALSSAYQDYTAGKPLEFKDASGNVLFSKPSKMVGDATIDDLNFAKSIAEFQHYHNVTAFKGAPPKQFLPYDEIIQKQSTTFGVMEKKLIEEAAIRNITYGSSIKEYEKDINSIQLYRGKAVSEYRQEFEDYSKTGRIKTSYGGVIEDLEVLNIKSQEDKAKRFAQMHFELEESMNLGKNNAGAYVHASEDTLKSMLFSRTPISAPLPEVNFVNKSTIYDPNFKIPSSNIQPTPIMPGKLSVSEIDDIVSPMLKENFDNGLGEIAGNFMKTGAFRKYFGLYAAGTAGLGMLSALQPTPKREASALTPDYDQWFQNQVKFFGGESNFNTALRDKYFAENDGLQEDGINAVMRKINTDFGSPYQGPDVSYMVFENQKLMKERENFLQQAFVERHFTQKGDIYNMLRSFTSSGQQFVPVSSLFPGYDLPSEQAMASLKGKNLMKLRLDDGYSISVEDADTITIQKKGATNNALSKFMGSGSYSFRLAGIDAPETAHDDRAAQPYAEAAKANLQRMIANKQLEVVVDPFNVTYGRQVATIFAGGKNVNLDLLRSGSVAYLPYEGKGQEQMYNEKAFSAAYKYAAEAKRGMWAEPFFQAYSDMFNKSGKTVTFNTFANPSKVARNASLLNIYSTMVGAQESGEYSEFFKQEMKQNIDDLNSKSFQNNQTFDFLKTAEMQRIYSKKNFNNPLKDDYASRQIDASLNQARHNEYMSEMQYDLKRLIESKGSKNLINKLKTTTAMTQNNVSLVDNAMYGHEVKYNTMKQDLQYTNTKQMERTQKMQAMQHKALLQLKQSPIGHHRM